MTSPAARAAARPAVVSAGRPDVALYPPGASFGPRTLADLEFVWLLSGSATWTVGTKTRQLRPGLLALARPGPADTLHWDARQTSTHAYVHFSLAEPTDLDDLRGWPYVRPLTGGDPMAALCRFVVELGGAPAPEPPAAMLTDALTLLLRLFVSAPELPATTWTADPHLLRVTRHLRRAWAGGPLRPVGIAELATAAGLSAGHLNRVFRRHVGIAPARAVELLRLGRAAGLLDRSNLAVAAVGTACGFADPFHFSKRFRATYGVSPRGYRSSGPHDDPWAPLSSARLRQLARFVVAARPGSARVSSSPAPAIDDRVADELHSPRVQ